MKRHLFLGLGILVGVVILGLLLDGQLTRMVDETESHILKAWKAAEADNLPEAWNYACQAKACWEQAKPLVACLTNHEELRAIDQDMASLEARYSSADSKEFAWISLMLTRKLRDLVDWEKLSLENILAHVL